MGRWRSPQAVEVQPPFLRPSLTEAQLEAKVLDNGIQNDRHSTRVSDPKSNKHTTKTSNLHVDVWTLELHRQSHAFFCYSETVDTVCFEYRNLLPMFVRISVF